MNNLNNNVNVNEKRVDISVFLERLIDQYKNKQLTEDQERRITEFYLKECYLNESSKESWNEQKESSNERNDPNDSTDNSFKYLTMGWYIYEHLIKKK